MQADRKRPETGSGRGFSPVKGQIMIGNVAQKRTQVVALAALLALVAAMFVAFAPARAHDLGECSDSEYLTEAACIAVVGDNPATTDQVETDFPLNTWTAGTHTAANHPPTLSVIVLDSDKIVADDSSVAVMVLVSGIFLQNPRSDDTNIVGANDGPSDETVHPENLSLEYVRVSGELSGPATAPNLEATPNIDDDNSVGRVIVSINIPAGTTGGAYTVSSRLAPDLVYYDYSGNEMDPQVGQGDIHGW